MAEHDRKRIKASKLLDKLPTAILEGANVRQLALKEGLSQVNASNLVAAIGTPLEEFNAKLIGKLGRIADKYLDRIEREVDNMPLNALAYTGLMLLDKRTNLTGRSNPAGQSVNVQINNSGVQFSKEDLLDLLEGKKKPSAPAIEATTAPAPETQPEGQEGGPQDTQPPPHP